MPAGPLDPDRLATTEFATSFRGYDTAEVRALLVEVAEALRGAAVREHELREQLARAEQHLREVRDAASDESVQALEQAAEEGRRQGREMVAEAQRVRERMLGDLARRRRHARQQVEQLMAGRERLLEAFDTARQSIETATQEMRTSLPEARQAAEAAGRRFDHDGAADDDDDAVAALEGEIEAARIAGLPIIEPGDDEHAEHDGAASTAGEARGGEASLLGERDMREMPPVELGAEFEDVRIVVADEAPAGDEDEDDGDAIDPEGLADVDADADADGTSESEEPVADPERLDDLFATLRAARAEAVVDAKSVLARGEPADDAEVPTAEDVAPTEPEPAGLEPPPPVHEPAASMDAVEVDVAITAAADLLASALKRVLADEQNELLERLRGLRKNQTAVDAGVLGDGADLAARFAAVAADPLAAVALAGMDSVDPGPRARPPTTPPMAAAVAAGLVDPLRERLDRGLGEAGADADEATERVRATFREWKTQRIAALAADAARSAFHAGLLAGVARGAALRWTLDDAEGACPECADNALAGAVAKGTAYPTGHRHPPAHDGCRCLLRPVEEAPT